MEIDHEGRIPKYVQLAAILRGQIERGEFPPDRPIPAKKALQQTYGVSQGTAERAVDLLRQEGLVETSSGRGVFVIPPEERRSKP
jgi:GntR family transcriptional regulator